MLWKFLGSRSFEPSDDSVVLARSIVVLSNELSLSDSKSSLFAEGLSSKFSNFAEFRNTSLSAAGLAEESN